MLLTVIFLKSLYWFLYEDVKIYIFFYFFNRLYISKLVLTF